jgi:hypothetical protein
MMKIYIAAIVLLVVTINSIAQSSASANSSVSAIIIHPVGTEQVENTISGSFILGNKGGTVEFNSAGVTINGKTETRDSSLIPSFLLSGSQYGYTITVDYEPMISHKDKTMRIESLTPVPLYFKPAGEEVRTRFSMKTNLCIGEGQQPGEYRQVHPYLVTIHFN